MTGAEAAEDFDERKGLEQTVAAGLAELSEAESTPKSEVTVASPFEAGDIDFNEPGWVGYVYRIQDWLRLSRQLELASDPRLATASLFDAMEIQDPDAAYVASGEEVLLTDYGLEALRDRVDRAIEFKDLFNERLEDDGIEAATEAWIQSWDDAVEQTVSGPIKAKASVWSIDDFASRARRGKLELSPSYQRGDVWPHKDAQLLIESIVRGIPLPSVIILKPKKGGAAGPFEVVDGKQRLTAILRFMGAHPLALETVSKVSKEHGEEKLVELFKEDYPAFRTLWKNTTGESLTSSVERDYYFPFKLSTGKNSGLVGSLENLRGKYFHEVKNHPLNVGDEEVELQDVFLSSTDYKIPVIEYSEATPRQIHEVFEIYNKQGKHLNAEEIRNAVYHDVDLLRALAVAAGDHKPGDSMAFLDAAVPAIETIRTSLKEYGIAEARYRRTKVLSWVYSLAFVNSLGEDGRPRMLSTSRQINEALLDGIQKAPEHRFRQHDVINESLLLVAGAMDAHASVDAWAPTFKDTKSGAKWQELQLVASLLGVVMATAVLGEEVEPRLIGKEKGLLLKTATGNWQRPSKTQTATQWDYISRIALAVLAELEVDTDAVDQALTQRFDVSCVPTLLAIAKSTT